MLDERPFGNTDTLLDAARRIWQSLGEDDWTEAFSHHPRIGDRDTRHENFAHSRDLSAREQAGVAGAPADILQALADGNHAYESKFGFVFLVCATGKTAADMLATLRERFDHDRQTELRIAAKEQEKITAIRLEGLRAV